MFAGHGPVGAGAGHLHVRPLRGEKTDPQLFAHRENVRIEFPRGEFCDDQRRLRDFIQKLCDLFGRNLRQLELNSVERVVIPGNTGLHDVFGKIELEALDASGVRVGLAARNAVVIVNMSQRQQPLPSPPRRTVFRACHEACPFGKNLGRRSPLKRRTL